MTGSLGRPTCFLSYARADDESFVERLRDVLTFSDRWPAAESY
jgi:hypothetical protein